MKPSLFVSVMETQSTTINDPIHRWKRLKDYLRAKVLRKKCPSHRQPPPIIIIIIIYCINTIHRRPVRQLIVAAIAVLPPTNLPTFIRLRSVMVVTSAAPVQHRAIFHSIESTNEATAVVAVLAELLAAYHDTVIRRRRRRAPVRTVVIGTKRHIYIERATMRTHLSFEIICISTVYKLCLFVLMQLL